MPNLPLDANDEDLLQRGLRRPSLDQDFLPINETFQSVRNVYDNSAPGLVSTDNIWPQRAAEELAALSPEQRREYLEQRGLIPPADAIPYNANINGLDDVISGLGDVTDNETISALSAQGNFTERLNNIQSSLDDALSAPGGPTDSYGQSLSGPTTQPRPITSTAPGGSYTPVGVQPATSSNSVYTYEPIDLYDDRYDFATGKIIRKGIATGAKGGVGQEEGNTLPPQGLADTQSEAPPPPLTLTQNDTTAEQYDDAILRQARAQEYSSPTVNNETTARIAEQEDQTVDYTGGADTPPPRTESSPPVERASRQAIRESRTQTTQDIKNARRRGENLVRKRHPDGTYYAAPAGEYDSKRLPQRAQDLGF